MTVRAVIAAALGLLVVAASGCPEPEPISPIEVRDCGTDPPSHCFTSHYGAIAVSNGVACHAECIDRAIDRALAYWSGKGLEVMPDVLAGWIVSFSERGVLCNGGAASGCCSWVRRTIELQALDPRCPETAQIVHELGHVFLHDPGHEDALWDWVGEQQATYDIVRAADASPDCRDSPYYRERPVRGAATLQPERR